MVRLLTGTASSSVWGTNNSLLNLAAPLAASSRLSLACTLSAKVLVIFGAALKAWKVESLFRRPRLLLRPHHPWVCSVFSLRESLVHHAATRGHALACACAPRCACFVQVLGHFQCAGFPPFTQETRGASSPGRPQPHAPSGRRCLPARPLPTGAPSGFGVCVWGVHVASRAHSSVDFPPPSKRAAPARLFCLNDLAGPSPRSRGQAGPEPVLWNAFQSPRCSISSTVRGGGDGELAFEV